MDIKQQKLNAQNGMFTTCVVILVYSIRVYGLYMSTFHKRLSIFHMSSRVNFHQCIPQQCTWHAICSYTNMLTSLLFRVLKLSNYRDRTTHHSIVHLCMSNTMYHSLEKIRREKIFVGRHVRRKLNTQTFLPQRIRLIYNGLQPTKMKIFYHRIFSHEYFQPLIFPKLWYCFQIGISFSVKIVEGAQCQPWLQGYSQPKFIAWAHLHTKNLCSNFTSLYYSHYS